MRLLPPLFRIDLVLVVLCSVALASACAAWQPDPARYKAGYTENGHASWYGPGFHGKLTANGEVYDQEGLTAAHRYMPFGTRVEVTRLDTGARVVVRITDRGPFVRGRSIDLSKGAARAIDSIAMGVVPVRLRIIGERESRAAGGYTIQLGKFRDIARAEQLRSRLGQKIPGLRITPTDNPDMVRLVTRRYVDYDRATRVAYRIRRDLTPGAFVTEE